MSGSSFDEVPQERKEALEALYSLDKTPDYEAVDIFVSVSRLYCHYKSTDLRLRGAPSIRGGVVPESEIDFVISTELIAKRVLDLRMYTMWQRFSVEGSEAVEKLLPSSVKKTLATHWTPVFFGFPKLFTKAQRAYDAEQRERKRKETTAKWHAEQAAQLEAQQLLSEVINSELDASFAENL